MVRNAVLAEESATILCDEHIVFNTDTSEVLVGLELVEIEELSAMARSLPVVDEGRDKVYARLVGNNEAFLKAASHAQTVGAKLVEAWTCLSVEAYVDLVETLHVVNVHTHHVAQSVGQEHGVGSGCNSLVGVALHESELLQTFGHESAYGKVYT